MVKKLFLVVGGVVLALLVVVAARTALTGSRQLDVQQVKPVAVDSAAAAERLAQAVRFKTISSETEPGASADQFDALHAFLRQSFPKAHEVLKLERVGKHALLYTWPGSDPKARPFALMAHQDVVPIAPGTEGDWQQPPFAGVIDGGYVWGRGAWDDKSNLMSILEAVEKLAASGFQPRQTIYLSFGADEELGGPDGAQPASPADSRAATKRRRFIAECSGRPAGPRTAATGATARSGRSSSPVRRSNCASGARRRR